MKYEDRVREAAEALRPFLDGKPEVALVLGSGLGLVVDQIENSTKFLYTQIPNFPTTSMPGHEGNLYIGEIEGVPIIGFQGRVHYQENPTLEGLRNIAFPVHLAAELGSKIYFPTNAAGGLNSNYSVGDLVAINDHNGLFMPEPIVGDVLDFDKHTFPPMDNAYNRELRDMLIKAGGGLAEGVYSAKTGRTYETPAEARILRMMGIDLAGMSTIPEVAVARNRGLDVVAMSLVTNMIAADGKNKVTHGGVTDVTKDPKVQARIASTLSNFFKEYNARFME